mmetsp:Transcript_31718/g.82759  ORF Transcript_31718/g.82759 Transcript_31718/m.82759 type:complete len:86 (+) Transcript_31718:1014-1271(+)
MANSFYPDILCLMYSQLSDGQVQIEIIATFFPFFSRSFSIFHDSLLTSLHNSLHTSHVLRPLIFLAAQPSPALFHLALMDERGEG